MRLLEKSPYLDIAITKNERRLNPQSITQTKLLEGYTLTIKRSEDAEQQVNLDKSGSYELFFNVIKEAAQKHIDNSKTLSNDAELILHFSNNQETIEQFLKDLRYLDLDSFCQLNDIKTTTGDLIYQGLSSAYSGLILLTNALIQNATIALSNQLTANKKGAEFGPGMGRL